MPMAAVYAACMVFVAQVMGRFIATDNFTVAEWYQLLKKNPTRAIKWMGLRVMLLLGMVALFINSLVPFLGWISTLLPALLGLLVARLMFVPWSNWVVAEMATRDGDAARGESADDTSVGRRLDRRRRGRRI